MKLRLFLSLILQITCIGHATVPTFSLWESSRQADSENGLEVSDPKTLPVTIESFNNDLVARNIGLSETMVRDRTELRLLRAGILPAEESSSPLDPYYLYVRVTITPNAYSIDAELIRILYFDARGITHRHVSATWDTSTTGEHRMQAAPIMDSLDSQLDRFLNGYRLANQRIN